MPRRTTALKLLAVPAATLLFSACSGTHPRPAPTHGPPKKPHLAKTLPPGFSTPAPGARQTPTVLLVAPVTKVNPAALRRGPFPRNRVRDITQAIVNQPVPTRVRPLLVSAADFHAGQTLTVAAGDLPAFPHDVQFTLQGPGLLAQRLVRVVNGVAVGAVTLPRPLGPGTWALGAEDLSGVRASRSKRPTGTALLDLTIFTVAR